MSGTRAELVERHLRACGGLGAVVGQADGRWTNPSPCAEWDARGVLEHVIGFHDVLLLRPLGAKPDRPRDDPVARWEVTVGAIAAALGPPDGGGGDGDGDAAPVDVDRLLPVLTADVLAHTWDLARAVGVADGLDPELCELAYRTVSPNEARLAASGMFGAPVPVPDDADPATRLVAFLGRDPAWRAP